MDDRHLYIKKYAMTESGRRRTGRTRQLFLDIEGLWDESADTGGEHLQSIDLCHDTDCAADECVMAHFLFRMVNTQDTSGQIKTS